MSVIKGNKKVIKRLRKIIRKNRRSDLILSRNLGKIQDKNPNRKRSKVRRGKWRVMGFMVFFIDLFNFVYIYSII